MTIDERIESLTRNVELLVQIHQDNENRKTKRDEDIDRLVMSQTKTEILIRNMGAYAMNVMHNHETRLASLEQIMLEIRGEKL
jgi:hypothetical protein